MLDFSGKSSLYLLQLIAAATAELVRRQAVKPAASVESVIVAPPGPSGHELRFVAALLRRLKTRKLIRAAEKDEYAAIAARHEAWFRLYRYPLDLRGRGGQAFAEHGAITHGE